MPVKLDFQRTGPKLPLNKFLKSSTQLTTDAVASRTSFDRRHSESYNSVVQLLSSPTGIDWHRERRIDQNVFSSTAHLSKDRCNDMGKCFGYVPPKLRFFLSQGYKIIPKVHIPVVLRYFTLKAASG